MSSQEDKQFPTIGLNVPEGRSHIAAKVHAAWKYIYHNYLGDFDFFVKTDPDTYVVLENLNEYLSDKNASSPHFYGHRFSPKGWNLTYMAGGPGLVLTRESLRRLVTKAFQQHPNCLVDGQGKTLSMNGGTVGVCFL